MPLVLPGLASLLWWSVSVAGTTAFIWTPISARIGGYEGLSPILGLGPSLPVDIALAMGIGVLFTLTLPFVIGGLATTQANLLALFLNRSSLSARVADLETSKAAAQAAEVSELQRLERDIHDGPQQRLVRLTMDLGRALKQLEDDPEAAKETVSTSLEATKDTLEELRNLSRGIAPPVLVDRGLHAALTEVVARSTVPTTLSTTPEADKLPVALTHTIYFLVSEALSNIAKHSGARRAEVVVEAIEGVARVTVTDDGRGGADPSRGSGLRGLADRIAGFEGTFAVESPAGGPTTLRAEIPCGS